MSDRLVWCDDFSVGNNAIDAQHALVFSIAEEMRLLLIEHANSPRLEISSQLSNLSKKFSIALIEHFAYEEHVLSEMGFSELASHKELHCDATAFMETLLSDNDGSVTARGKRFSSFMRTWLYQHILVEDMKYADFLKSKASQQPTIQPLSA